LSHVKDRDRLIDLLIHSLNTNFSTAEQSVSSQTESEALAVVR